MERLEDLLIKNLKIYQDDELYCFTSDSVLLSRFADVKKGDEVADFCAGSGIVGVHLYGLNSEKVNSVTLFEMQKELYDLSVKSIELNSLENKFTAVNCKVQDIDNCYCGKFSLIICNPPYQKVGSGMVQEKTHISMCHFEQELTLPELIKSASRCLKYGGRFALCHRADRLTDVMCEMRNYNIEPKKLQLVYSGKGQEPYLVLVQGVKGGKSGLKILKGIKN